MKKIYILLVLILHILILNAQDMKLFKTVKLPGKTKSVSLDRYNLFYVADEEENISKYDTLGILQTTFSPLKKGDITLFEAWRNVNIFVFYRNFQEFIILDRFMNPTPNSSIDENQVGFARLATVAYDNNLWIFDDVDFSLKKYNLSYNNLDLHTSLDLILDPSNYDMNFMREYQNLLFINDKNSGVLVFDNLGNYKSKIPLKGMDYFSFYNDELYFIEKDAIHLYNIYNKIERLIPLPKNKKYSYALLGQKMIYLFSNDTVDMYQAIF